MKLSPLLPAIALLLPKVAQADDWLYFTGPHHTGVSEESSWNARWGGSGPKIAWKAEVGTGAASFAVKGERVVTSGGGKRKDTETIFCLHRDTGDVLWKHEYECEFDERMFEGGTAATPTIDGDLVYNASYDGQVKCLQLADGKVVWETHLLKDHGGELSRWKYATSPLVIGDLVILDCGGEPNSTLALDKKTGKKVWGQGDENAGYATPTPILHQGKPAVAVFKGKALVAHDVKTGNRLWTLPWKTSYDVNASSPVPVGKTHLLVSSGYGGGRAALFDLRGSKPKRVWQNDEIKTKMSSCVVYQNHVYAVCGDSDGRLICASLRDGSTKWSQKGFGFGTLTLAGDKLIALSDKGNLVIAQATGDGYQPISQAHLLRKTCWVKPVLSQKRLFMKNNEGSVVSLDLR